METSIKNEVTGIAKDEKTLFETADDLWEAGFSMHEISVQGDPIQLKQRLGIAYPDPNLIADNPKTPRKELMMPEEYGWLLAFSFVIPLLVGMVLGSIFASGASPLYGAILQGLLIGGIVGSLIGIILVMLIKIRHDMKIEHQMAMGGFVIWVHVDSPEKLLQAKKILEHDGIYNIHEHLDFDQEL